MTEAGYALESPARLARSRGRARAAGLRSSTALWVLVAGNAALMVWLWVHGGNVSDDLTTGELLTSLARITGLLGAYSALLQVLLLARLPAGRAAVRLRPPDRVAPLERPRLPRPDPRARRSLGLGLCPDGQDLPAERSQDDARWRRLPGHDHRDGRNRSAHRRRRDLGRDRPAPASLRGLVRGASARVRRDCACVVPSDPDRERARARSRRGRLLARAVSSARSVSSSRFGSLVRL